MKPFGWVVEYRDEPRGKIKVWQHVFGTKKDAHGMWGRTTRPWYRIVPLHRGKSYEFYNETAA